MYDMSMMMVTPLFLAIGDNVITGSYDSRLHWFDMDLSTKPYQTLKYVFDLYFNMYFTKWLTMIFEVKFPSSRYKSH